MAGLTLNIIQCLYSMLEQLAPLASPGDFGYFFLNYCSRLRKLEMHNILASLLPLPWARQPTTRTQALYAFKLLSETIEEQLYNALPHHRQLNSTQYVIWPAPRSETLLVAPNIAVKALRYTTYILVPGSVRKSVCWHHFSNESSPLTRNGWSAPGYRTVGLLFKGKSNHLFFLQFQLAWLNNNKSCYWHPELFLLGAGRLRNGRGLQGSGTQGSLLLTGAKKPEIALPKERCTISRQ